MANINVTTNTIDVTVSEANASNLVVSTTDNQIIVSDSSILSNAEVRALFSVTNAGGDGSLAYDGISGVFTYTGVTAAETRAHIGNTAPILYDSTSGVISIDEAAVFAGKTTDDLTEGNTNLYFTDVRVDTRVPTSILNGNIILKQVKESVYTFPTPKSGNIDLGLTAGTVFVADLAGDITNIQFTHENAGTFATLIVTQPDPGGYELLASNFTSTYNWAGNVSTINPDANATSLITITYDGSEYYASVTTFDDQPTLTTDDISEGASNLYLNGSGTSDDLTEGTTNLFFTPAAANTSIENYSGNIAGPIRFLGNVRVASTAITNPDDGLNIRIFDGATGGDATMIIEDENANISFYNGQIRNIMKMGDPWVGYDSSTTAYIRFGSNDLYRLGANISYGGMEFSEDGGSTFYPLPKSTDNLAEGSGNLYFTNARADARVNLQTGTNLDLSSKSTSDLTEGTNLYYTDGRFDTRLATKSTSDLTEGTNLYYTDARVDAHLTGGTGIDYTAGTIDLADTAVTPGTYGDASNIPQLIVDQQGRITGVSDVAISIPASYGNVEVADFLANGFGSNTITTTGDITTTGFFEGDLNGAVTVDVYNNTGSTLNKGDAVYLTGGHQGDNPHVALADADDAAKMPALGIIKRNISASAVGQVVTSGVMSDSSHGYTLGADLYIDTTAGGLTTTVPTGEDKLIQKIGKVVSPNHIIVQGAFRTNATPNLDEGNIFLGSTSNTAITVTPSTNFVSTGNAFELSNTLSNVNTITTEDATGFTVNSRDGIIFKQEFSNTDTEVANISGDGFSFRNNNLYTNLLTYSGANAIVAYKFNGTITSGSNEIAISSVNRYQDDAAAAVSDLAVGMVYADSLNFGSSPKGFARTAYVQSVDSANSKVVMSETAQASLSVTDSTFWNAMVDTTRGQIVQLQSEYDATGGSNTSLNNGLPVNPDAYGYPSTGFSATDFDVISVGTSSDYSWNASIANFMVGRTAFAAEGTAPKFINGLVVGENTSLTNRAENDNLESFGINVMWDGVSSAGSTSKIPQVLMKSYTDNTLATVPNAINQSQKSLAGPRLFFTSADGNANDYAFDTYPKVNQELGRIAWWGSNAESLTPSSVYTPALISVIPHDDWETQGDSALDPAGNADMYFASTVDNTQGADVFMSYQGGKLTLASGKRADEDRHGIYFAPAEQNKKLMPKAIGLTYYEGNSKYWSKIGPANVTADEGSQLTITNGGDRGSTVGDLKMSIHRENEPTLDFSVHGVFDAVLVTGNPANYGQIAITVPDEVSSYHVNMATATLSGTFAESASGNENGLSGNTYRLIFAANVGGDIGYDIYLVYTTGFAPLTYSAIGGSTPYPSTAPQVSYIDPPLVSVTNTQGGYSDKEWTLELNYPNDELNLKVDGSTVIEYSNVSTTFTNIPVMPSYSNTSLPSSIAGGQIYITNGNNKPAYGDGTNWYYMDDTQVT